MVERVRPQKMKGKEKQPAWKEKIEKDIKILRGQLPLLSEIAKGSNVKKSKRKYLEYKLGIRKKEDMPAAQEILKPRIQAKAQRIRRFEKRSRFFRQNKSLRKMQKLYRELDKKKIDVKETPTTKDIEEFWSKI